MLNASAKAWATATKPFTWRASFSKSLAGEETGGTASLGGASSPDNYATLPRDATRPPQTEHVNTPPASSRSHSGSTTDRNNSCNGTSLASASAARRSYGGPSSFTANFLVDTSHSKRLRLLILGPKTRKRENRGRLK